MMRVIENNGIGLWFDVVFISYIISYLHPHVEA